MDIERCWMRETKIYRRDWLEIMKVVTDLKIWIITNTQKNKTLYEIVFGEKPNVDNLKIYASRVFVRASEVFKKSKRDDRLPLGVLVNYADNEYTILVNNRVFTAMHVEVVKENINLICL